MRVLRIGETHNDLFDVLNFDLFAALNVEAHLYFTPTLQENIIVILLHHLSLLVLVLADLLKSCNQSV